MKRPPKHLTRRWIIAIIVIPACVLWVFFWLVAGPRIMEMLRDAGY